ncbi:hemocyte protein-glutamine gamma-glutamyltransferase-like [Plakobranchus ocellatus]|uniref:Hemocyte protein-glutamine gamma-glutamyltransferase-like n=1 Tax=Plakobranchus ocellatus TaxID=259542 RepID=A0AAV4BTH8_9GAST|nr:hemocyte protein-glutamine gamma-glutamyltransferase-like [Plakobranchus ocellatus]
MGSCLSCCGCCCCCKNKKVKSGEGTMNNNGSRSTDIGRKPIPYEPGAGGRSPGHKPKPSRDGRIDNNNTPDPSTLTVQSVDLNIWKNTKAHHTFWYDICTQRKKPKLVLRRGQPFDIEVDFNREYKPEEDDLKLVFEAGDRPNPTKGTYVEFVLSDKDEPKKWGAKIVTKKNNSLTITVFTPPDLYVGEWELSIDVVKKNERNVDVYKYEHEDPIYIIFNPWCKDDQVYLHDEDLLREYVLKETGKIYCGSARNITSRPWNFGQVKNLPSPPPPPPGGVGRTVASESALRSAGTLLSRVRAPLPALWPDGGPKRLRSPCCGLALYKKPNSSTYSFFLSTSFVLLIHILLFPSPSLHSLASLPPSVPPSSSFSFS